MTTDRRVLIASRDAGGAWRSRQRLEGDGDWRVVGIVDPRVKVAFENGFEVADVILIEAVDLIWLLDHRPNQSRAAFKNVPPMVLMKESDILEIVTRGDRSWGLLIQQQLATMSSDRLALAYDGYIVITANLGRRLQNDGPRMEIAETLSPQEINVLVHLGEALSNREISSLSGLSEIRVKALARTLARKLCLRNRTALAVFAVENGALLSLMANKVPNSSEIHTDTT